MIDLISTYSCRMAGMLDIYNEKKENVIDNFQKVLDLMERDVIAACNYIS